MTERFSFTAAGESVDAAIARPAGTAPAGSVIVVHEWWGLNDGMRHICDRFAVEGFVALAVDLYGGRVATEPAVAMQLSGELKTARALEIVAAASEALRSEPRGNGRVAVTGFCLGGAIALAAACSVDGLLAAVPFYGIPKPEFFDVTKLRAPVLAHYGDRDPVIPAERPKAIADAAHAAGKAFTLHMYEAGHAFMRETDPQAYVPEAATRAWERTIAFLRSTVG